MTANKKTPAKLVMDLFGGGRSLARKLNAEGMKVHHTSVTRWAHAKNDGGCDGRIPAKYHVKLLEMAKAEGLELKPEHLVYGG